MTEVVVVIGPGQIGQAIAWRVGFGKRARNTTSADPRKNTFRRYTRRYPDELG